MNQEEQLIDMQALSDTVQTLVSTWGLRVVGALAVLIVGWIAAKAIRASARKAMAKRLDPTLVPFLSGMIYYAVLAFVMIAVLGLFGIQTTSFVAVLGAMGLAVGLALQGTLSNFAAGVMLLVFRPFKLGDFVEAAGVAGSVQEIGIFATTLHTGDNVKIIVGNGAVYGSTIKNYSANDTRRIDLVIGVSYGDDLQRAKETIDRVLGEEARVLKDPAPTVAVSELADSSVNFVVRPWCNARAVRSRFPSKTCTCTRSRTDSLESTGRASVTHRRAATHTPPRISVAPAMVVAPIDSAPTVQPSSSATAGIT
jgi:small conductance mechanosensitive channel